MSSNVPLFFRHKENGKSNFRYLSGCWVFVLFTFSSCLSYLCVCVCACVRATCGGKHVVGKKKYVARKAFFFFFFRKKNEILGRGDFFLFDLQFTV